MPLRRSSKVIWRSQRRRTLSRHDDPEENPERWLVSYADFITLLFAFFAVLYATSEVNLEKAQDFQRSIQEYLIRYGSFGDSGQRTNTGVRYNTTIQPPVRTFPRSDGVVGQLKSKVETLLEDSMDPETLQNKLSDLTVDELGVRVSFRANDIFAKDSAQLTRKGVATINRFAGILKKLNNRLLIETHSRRPLSSRAAYPSLWEFTSARSATIVRYLIRVHGLQPNRLSAVGYGNSRLPGGRGGDPERLEFFVLAADLPI